MAAYQKRLRNHLWVASWEEAFVTPEPVCSSPRPGNDNLYKPEGSFTGCFPPQNLEPLPGTHPHRYYGSVRNTDSSLVPMSHPGTSRCYCFCRMHPLTGFCTIWRLGEEGEARFCYLYFCGVLLTQASRPTAEGTGATGKVHPDTNG